MQPANSHVNSLTKNDEGTDVKRTDANEHFETSSTNQSRRELDRVKATRSSYKKLAYLGVTLIAVGLCLYLSNWQYQKGIAVAQSSEKMQQQLNLPAISQEQWQGQKLDQGQRLNLFGMYLFSPIVLLENRILNGKAGYEVLQGFQPISGPLVVVSRGWIAAPLDRTELPEIVTPSQSIRIELEAEQLRNPANFGTQQNLESFNLIQNNDPNRAKTIFRAQYFGLDNAKEIFGSTYVFRPFSKNGDEPNNPNINKDEYGFQPIPKVITSSKSEKHFGYSIQWLLIALAVVVIAVKGFRYDK